MIMKNISKLFIVLLSLSLTSCGFITYVEASSSTDQAAVSEVLDKKNEYINKLDELYNEDNYEEDERKVFISYLVEAKAKLRECNNDDELKAIFESNCEKINGIKTKQQYAEELEQKKTEYIDKISGISSEGVYRDDEKETYNFYIESAIKAINDIGSIKEDFEKIYLTYKGVIEAIKTDADYLIEEANAFEAYKLKAINEIEEYLNLDDYREEEVSSIKDALKEASDAIDKSTEYEEIDNLVRKYKTDVYSYETDEELYVKELQSLITSSKTTLANYKNTIDYRENEVVIINAMIDSFNIEIDDIETKEEVTTLVNTYKALLDSIKTDAQLYAEEKQLLTDTLFVQLKAIVDYDNLLDNDKTYYDNFYLMLINMSTKEEVNYAYLEEKTKGYKEMAIGGDVEALVQYQLCIIEELNSYLDKSLYREAQQQEIDAIITGGYSSILSCTTYSDTVDALNTVKNSLDDVKTNNEMWEQEDVEFFNTLHSLYGDDVLIPEGSLIEANDYYELANIIDYYTFYQLDASSFVRNTFRVKINWNHKDATFEKREVFWYSELLRFAAGIDMWFEDGNYLVIKLIPYDFASVDVISSTEKIDNLVEYKTNDVLNDRTSGFDDFGYNNYDKSVVCWNSQQLWYALEHDYIPLCVPGSKASIVFDEAKNILRNIIKNGMSDEQKVFEIYKWCGKNWCHDDVVVSSYYLQSSNLDEYPDEKVSLASSLHAEGGIIEKTVVCSSAAKAYLILLRIEGIKCLRILEEYPNMFNVNTINSVPYHTVGSHEVVLVNIQDNWYYSDPLYSITNFTDTGSYLSMLLPISFTPWPTRQLMFESTEDINYSLYEPLSFNNQSILVKNESELNALMSFVDSSLESGTITILYNLNSFDAFNYLKTNYPQYNYKNYSRLNFREIAVYF